MFKKTGERGIVVPLGISVILIFFLVLHVFGVGQVETETVLIDCDGNGKYDVTEEIESEEIFTQEDAFRECEDHLNLLGSSVDEIEPRGIEYKITQID